MTKSTKRRKWNRTFFLYREIKKSKGNERLIKETLSIISLHLYGRNWTILGPYYLPYASHVESIDARFVFSRNCSK